MLLLQRDYSGYSSFPVPHLIEIRLLLPARHGVSQLCSISVRFLKNIQWHPRSRGDSNPGKGRYRVCKQDIVRSACCGAEMEPLPITLVARCGCSWQHAVCRMNHPSGMPIVSPHGTFFLLILSGMRLDVEDKLFLHSLPLPHLCQAKSKVKQLSSQEHRIQADELSSRSLQDTCPLPDISYSCCCISHNIHYRSYSPACPHSHW